MTRPSAFADRLLERLVPGQDHDALLGDLREERERGRSVLWFGLQILAAIAVGSSKVVRANRGVALGAIATGFGFQIAFGNGLLLARITARQAGYPTTWMVDELLQITSDMFLGWSLVSLYRSYGITMLLAFRPAMLGVLLLIVLWYTGLFVVRTDITFLMLALKFRSVHLSRFLFQSIVMLAGGYLATRRPECG
jgi:hypothetical protein